MRSLKSKEAQASEPEVKDSGAQAFEFDLVKTLEEGADAPTNENVDNVFSSIESELEERLSSPFSLVPTNLRFIKVHALIHSDKEKERDKSKSGKKQ